MYEALLLDIGFVIIDVTWAAIDAYEKATGTGPPGREPVEREGDARWRAHVAGAITAERYWGEVARSRGLDGMTGLFRALAEVVPDELFDPDAVALMRDARGARRRVGVLSNEAYTFIGRDFFAGRPEFAELDAFVDATEVGARKTAPEAYLVAADALGGHAAGRRLPRRHPRVRGRRQPRGHARHPGRSVRPHPAFDRARVLLGLR